MKNKTPIRHWLLSLAAAACLVTLASVSAQPADGPGGPGARRGGRGFGPQLPPEQMSAINTINSKLTAEALAVTVASSNLVAASFNTPKDEAKIVQANSALAKAREAWATKASALFAAQQASTNKLSADAIAQLIATAPGGRGLGGGGRGSNLDAGIVFTRPSDSPGLGKKMELPKAGADGFIAMFNGKDLTGWDALPNFWSAKSGVIDCVETGEQGGNIQSDLIWIDSQEHPEKYANFELQVKFRWISHTGNSGVQFRGVIDRADTKHIGGYQADFDPQNSYTGAIYDESGKAGRRQKDARGPHMAPRGFKMIYPADGSIGKAEPLAENAQALAALVKPVGGEFNDLIVIADGTHITVKVNDHVFCDLIDENPGALKSGIIAFQQHAGAQMEIQFKDPKIKFLPGKP